MPFVKRGLLLMHDYLAMGVRFTANGHIGKIRLLREVGLLPQDNKDWLKWYCKKSGCF